MPTSPTVTPRRVLPFILAIPLLLLLLSIRAGGPGNTPGLVSADGPLRMSHRLPIPIPWEDDVLTTGLPSPQPTGKRILRKLVPARIPVIDQPPVARRKFPRGPRIAFFSPLDTLTESLLLSRPPPSSPLSDGNGGNKGNDGNTNRYDIRGGNTMKKYRSIPILALAALLAAVPVMADEQKEESAPADAPMEAPADAPMAAPADAPAAAPADAPMAAPPDAPAAAPADAPAPAK